MRVVMTGRSRKMVHDSYEDEQVASPKIPDPTEFMNRQLHVAINKGSTMIKSSVNSLQEESIKDTMPQLSKNKAKERSPVVRKSVNSIVKNLESTEDTMPHLSKNKERNSMVRSSVSFPQEESAEETWAHLSKKKTKQRNSVVKKNVNSIVQDLESTKDTMAHLSKNKERNSMVRRSVSSPQEESNEDTWAHWSKNKATSSKLLYSVEKLPSQPKQIVRKATSKDLILLVDTNICIFIQ